MNAPAATTVISPAARTAPAHVALFFATLFFGINYPVAKIALQEIPPGPMIAVRVFVSALLLGLAWRLQKAPSGLSRRDVPKLIVLAFLGVLINQGFFVTGLHLSTPINASVLMTTIPVTTIAFALLLGREKASRQQLVGTAIAFVGALYLVGVFQFEVSRRTMVGNILIFANACAYGMFLVLGRNILRRCSPVAFLTVLFALSSIVALPIGWFTQGDFVWSSLSLKAWLSIGYVVVFATAVAHLLNGWALRRVASSTVGIYVFLQPVIATTATLLFLGDPLHLSQIIAGALIFVGVYLAAIRRG